jgi:histidine triad (HIT) family protein
MDCVFCDIMAGKKPARIVLDSGVWVVMVSEPFLTSFHVMLIPKQHVDTLEYLSDKRQDYRFPFYLIRHVVEDFGLHNFQVAINEGDVHIPHLHIHIFGGTFYNDGFHHDDDTDMDERLRAIPHTQENHLC